MGEMSFIIINKKPNKNPIISICMCKGTIGIVSSEGRHGRINSQEIENKTKAIQLREKEFLIELVELIEN